MRRTDAGNLVLQAMDTATLQGTKLVFVDKLRASVMNLDAKVTQTWVECKDQEGANYAAFCTENAIELQDVQLLPYTDADGNLWTTEKGEPFHGLVTVG